MNIIIYTEQGHIVVRNADMYITTVYSDKKEIEVENIGTIIKNGEATEYLIRTSDFTFIVKKGFKNWIIKQLFKWATK